MKSFASTEFWKLFQTLPENIKKQATASYSLWLNNPFHPSLHFKRIHDKVPPLYSIRISLHWRALAVKQDDEYIWFWIGSHADYDRMIG